MASVATKEVSNVSMQMMVDVGLNPFAVQLLVESYAKHPHPPALTFVWRGVVVSLREYEAPPDAPATTRQEEARS